MRSPGLTVGLTVYEQVLSGRCPSLQQQEHVPECEITAEQKQLEHSDSHHPCIASEHADLAMPAILSD